VDAEQSNDINPAVIGPMAPTFPRQPIGSGPDIRPFNFWPIDTSFRTQYLSVTKNEKQVVSKTSD
jgi:hypothetical protein